MFVPPSDSLGDNVKVADLANALLIIEPTFFKEGIQTVHGVSDAIEVNIIDLDANKEYKDILFFNVALKNSLRNKIGQKVLARIGQGVAKPGKSAPWILLDATGDPEALAKANAYIGAAPAKPVPTPAPDFVSAPATGATEGLVMTPEIAALLAQLGAKPV